MQQPDQPRQPDHQGDRADALVMFGLTGDLGGSKLLPALADLAAAGRLDIPVVGAGRRDHDDAALREDLDRALAERADGDDPHRPSGAAADVRYVSGDATDRDTFDRIAELLGDVRLPVVYMALPPSLFGEAAQALAASGMPPSTRLVVEKPFGADEESARELYAAITAEIDPEQLYIVDHFLAKPAIENLLTVRTSNSLLANSLRPELVERVEVVLAEDGGVDGRGSFYESVGAIRDVLQNHLLQLLAFATMDPPADPTSDTALHGARQALLDAVLPIRPDLVVRGQYDGYRDLDDVADDSDVETFVSAPVRIDNDRWRDVPITIVTGKRLADPRCEVVVTLADTCLVGHAVPGNRIVFGVKPEPCLSFDLAMLDPDEHELRTTRVSTSTSERHGELGDYATMLVNALDGEHRHFATIDSVLAGWRVVDPVLADPPPLRNYEPDDHGPDAASRPS
jgi:glucose-6-phosphate 1-dehydrogenase